MVRAASIGIVVVDVDVVAGTLLSFSLVVGRRTPDNSLANPSYPVVLFLFRVGVQQIGNFRGRNLKGIPFAGLEVGRLDGRAKGQIDHPVGRRVFVGAIKELGTLEQKEAAAPVLFRKPKRRITIVE